MSLITGNARLGYNAHYGHIDYEYYDKQGAARP